MARRRAFLSSSARRFSTRYSPVPRTLSRILPYQPAAILPKFLAILTIVRPKTPKALSRKTPRAFVPSKISSTVSCQRKNNVSTKPKTAIIQAPAAPTAPTNNPSTNWPTLPPQFAQRAAKNTDSKNRSGITTLAFMRFSAFTSKHQIAATKVSIGRIQAARPTRLCSHVEMPFPTAPVNCGKARHMSKNGVTAKSKPNPHRMVFFTVLASLPLN